MESFALTFFVLCTCAGLLSVAVMARWLRSQPHPVPDLELESTPAEQIVTPLAASAGVAALPRHLSVLPEDDPTQPMTRTQAWGPSDVSDWPTTVLDPSQHPARVDEQADDRPAFADTVPMPLEPANV